LLRARSFRDSE